jgi:hypothetical protein
MRLKAPKSAISMIYGAFCSSISNYWKPNREIWNTVWHALLGVTRMMGIDGAFQPKYYPFSSCTQNLWRNWSLSAELVGTGGASLK